MTFEKFNFNNILNNNLEQLNYEGPTQIQEKSIDNILEGKDLLGIAATGTGKTAAFTFPILHKMLEKKEEGKVGFPKVLILAPTRELVAQIGETIRKYSKNTNLKTDYVYGGVKPEAQIKALSKRVDILVATPKRLVDLIKEKIISLDELKYLVIDEADNVVQTSAGNDLKFIWQKLPQTRQTLFFSATFDENQEKLANLLLKSPVRIKVEKEQKKQIFEKVLYVKSVQKNNLLLDLLKKKEIRIALIFVETKKLVDDLVRFLTENKIKSEALHSSKSNTHRSKVVSHIKSGATKYLISTDLAARGLDIQGITHVINYEVPSKVDDYIHRIGRCGRAGNQGVALTFCSSQERGFFRKIENNRDIEMMTHAYHSDVARRATGKEAQIKHKKVKHTFKPKKRKKSTYSNRRNKR